MLRADPAILAALFFRASATGVVAVTASMVALAEPLKLEGSKPLVVECDTKSVVVATDAAKATSGAIRLKLELALATAEKPKTGTWTIVSVDDTHKGAFAVAQRETCAKGCPFTVAANGEPQLWAPEAKTLDKLGESDSLLIAVIKTDSLALRASTFRGKDIEALEEGQCRMVP